MLNIHPSLLQRQQYPQLQEAEVQTKAQDWKGWDEKVKERREAIYRDSLTQQRSVSNVLVVFFFYTWLCVRDRHSHVLIVSLCSSHWAFRPYSTVGEFKWCRWPGPPSTSLDRPEENNHVLVREGDDSILHHVRDLVSAYRWTECMSNHCGKSALNSQNI